MLPRHRRLSGPRVKQILGASVSRHHPYLTIRVSANHLAYPRFGVMVSKKVAAKATLRNRLKRQLMAVIEIELNRFTSGQDYLMILRPGFKLEHFYEAMAIKTD